MATNWPNSVQTFTNPSAGDSLNSPSHSAQHSTVNDTVVALQQHAGLVFVKSQTVGSAVSSVTVTDAFSSTFDNYLIVMSGGVASHSGPVSLQLGSTATGYYGSFIYAATGGGAPAQVADNSASNFTHIAGATTSFMSARIDVHNPFTATATTVSSQGASYITINGNYNGYLLTTTSYTSFTLTPATGTLTGGTIRVYGYNNG